MSRASAHGARMKSRPTRRLSVAGCRSVSRVIRDTLKIMTRGTRVTADALVGAPRPSWKRHLTIWSAVGLLSLVLIWSVFLLPDVAGWCAAILGGILNGLAVRNLFLGPRWWRQRVR